MVTTILLVRIVSVVSPDAQLSVYYHFPGLNMVADARVNMADFSDRSTTNTQKQYNYIYI